MIDATDAPYEGTLSSLTRYGTMNTPSLKTGRERKGKAKVKTPPRYRSKAVDSTVTVYHVDRPDERYSVSADYYSRKRTSRTHSNSNSAAEQQARQDARLALLASVGNNSDCD